MTSAFALENYRDAGQEASYRHAMLGGLRESLGDFRKRSFDLDYCGVLAAKAQLFYNLGETGLKADAAVATLDLGLEHNRRFVEKKFPQMAGPLVEEAVARRITVELNVLNIDFAGEFTRLTRSISADPEMLHPSLQALLPA